MEEDVSEVGVTIVPPNPAAVGDSGGQGFGARAGQRLWPAPNGPSSAAGAFLLSVQSMICHTRSRSAIATTGGT